MLNAGQAAIFTSGLAADGDVRLRIRAGTKTVGDFVLINAMMIQLYQPLNFMGMVYREIKQALIDIETMFSILGAPAGDRRRAGRAAAYGAQRRDPFENVRFSYDPERPILKGHQLRGAGRQDGRDGRPVGRRQVDDLAAAVPLLRTGRRAHPHRRPGHRRRDQESLRAAIGMVPQDTVLFNDTIGYNIRYGRWEASDAEVREAARARADRPFHPIAPKATTPRSASAASSFRAARNSASRSPAQS